MAALLLSATATSAQVVAGESAVYRISSTGGTLTQFVTPIGVTWQAGPVRLDANTAFASATLSTNGGSSVSGLTDMTVRGMASVFSDRVRVILAANVPTGTESIDDDAIPVAAAIATDLFMLPVASFGAGFGATGALAVAQPIGEWVLGASGAYRAGGAYEPYVRTTTGIITEFRPGHEMRVRIALDRPQRSGWSTRLAVSLSRFSEDQLDGEGFGAAGNRFLGEAVVEFPAGRGAGVAYVWDLYRQEGAAIADTVPGAAARNLLGGGVRLALPLDARRAVRPLAELVLQHTADTGPTQAGDGALFRVGGGVAFRVGRVVVEPSVIGQFGQLNGERLTGMIVRAGLVWGR